MSVIIRLQGLPWSASALDIRNFFKGLTIPAGGVHIIGGDRGDAFIAFSSDEDARQAMMRNMSAINGTSVQLFLSSKTEMQNVIEEARNSDAFAAAAAVSSTTTTPATQMMQQKTGTAAGLQQQNTMQQGMGQGFQSQAGFQGGAQAMGGQRFNQLQQSDYQAGNNMSQGQYQAGQNFMGGQANSGQQGRDGQFAGQQQGFQMGQQQQPSGINSQQAYGQADKRLSADSSQLGQQNQVNTGNMGYGANSGYGGNGSNNQWQQNLGQVQGQDYNGSNSQFFNDDSSQGAFPPTQNARRTDQIAGGGQFSQQQLGAQGGDSTQKADNNFGFNQQAGFGVEGMQQPQIPGNDGRFPARGASGGLQDINRGGILPHPALSVKSDDGGMTPTDSQAGPLMQGQMPRRPGPGSIGTPDDQMRPSLLGRPDAQQMDQWGARGQDQGRGNDNYGMEGEGFAQKRGEEYPDRRGFSGDGRGRGMQPFSDMSQGKQSSFDREGFGGESSQWPGHGADEQGMGRGIDKRRDPTMGFDEEGRGQYRERDSDFRDAPGMPRFNEQQRGRYDPEDRSFERRPDGRHFQRGADGRSFEMGADERQFERGPDGRPFERRPDARPFERGPDGRPLERGLEERPFDRGFDERSFERGVDGRPFERGPGGRPFERGPDGRPFDRRPDGRPFERGSDGRPFERGYDQRPFERGPDGRPLDRGPDPRPFERGTDGRPLEWGPDGRPLERGPDGRPLERGPDGMPFERGPDGRPLERGPDGRPLERGPDGMLLEKGPDGMPLERGPDGRPLERGPDGRSLERGPDGRPLERGPDGRPLERGPDGRPLERGPDGRPLERGPDGRPLERGPDGRPLERGPDGRPLERGPVERGPDGRPLPRPLLDRPFDRGPDGKIIERVPEARMDRGPDERFSERGPDGRPMDRTPLLDRDGRPMPLLNIGPDGRPIERGPDGRPLDPEGRFMDRFPHERMPFDRMQERSSMERGPEGRMLEGNQDRRSLERGPDGRPFERGLGVGKGPDGRPGDERFGPDGRFGGPGGRLPLGEARFGQQEGSYDPMDMDVDPPTQEDPMVRAPVDAGFPGHRDIEGAEGGGFARRGGRGRDMDARGDMFRGRGGFDRGRGRGFGRFGQGRPGDDDFSPAGGFGAMEEGFGGPFPRDFDSRREGGVGHPDGERGRGRGGLHGQRGRMDGPRGRMGRGFPPHDMDTDRRFDMPEGHRGLLGDAPTGLLPDPAPQEVAEDKDSRPGRDQNLQRDRDRSAHPRDRRERDDRDRRDDRRRSDRRRSADRTRSRDRSPDRDRHQYRRDHRDRDRRDRDRDRTKDRRDSKDRGSSRSKDGKKDSDKESGKEDKDKKADEEKKTPATTEPVKPEENKFVQAKGFPVTYNYREVRRFFFGCDLPFDGIKIINAPNGLRSGDVYLKFVNEEAAKKAIQKSGETIFGKPVIVTPASSKLFEGQVDSQTPKTETNAGPDAPKKMEHKLNLLVSVRGLPINIKREDIIQHVLSAVKIADNGNALCIDCDGRNLATAYFEASSLVDFNKALGCNGRMFAGRPIQVTEGKPEDRELYTKKLKEMQERNKIGGQAPPQQQQQSQPGMAMGLIGQRTPGPMLAASKPLSLLSLPISTPRNGPVIEFNTPNHRPEEKLLGAEKSPPNETSFCVHIQGLPMLATYQNIRDFFEGLSIVPNRGVQIVHDGAGKPMGEGFVEFATHDDKEKGLKKDKTAMGRHILAVKSIAKIDMIERLRNARLVGLGPGQGPPPPPHLQPRGPVDISASSGVGVKPIPPGVLNRQWSYVSCQNFPPNVSITDILSFFQGYNPIPESIRLHYAADGSPTGNAVVGFPKQEDVNRGLRDLNGKQCRHSVVTLLPAM